MESVRQKNSHRVELIVMAAVTVVAGYLFSAHVPGANGPAYFQWPWQELGFWRVAPVVVLCFVPFLAAQFLFASKKIPVAAALALLCLTYVSTELSVVGLQHRPYDLNRVGRIVMNEGCTSYFIDALLQSQNTSLLAAYPAILPSLHLHSQTKPAGPLLFYRTIIRTVGPDLGQAPETFAAKLASAAMWGGLLVAIVSALSIPAVYLFVHAFCGDRQAAFIGASLYTLCAGPILFTPEFDQIYPIFTATLMTSWLYSLKKTNLLYPVACGIVLSIATFFAYNLLVVGVFMVGIAWYRLLEEKSAANLGRILKSAAIVLGTTALVYLGFWWFTHYDPMASFLAAYKNQKELLADSPRPYPQSIVFDLTDFLMASNYLVGIASLFAIRAAWREENRSEFRLILLCLLQVVIVAVTGLLQCETMRVWIFLIPFLILPAAVGLARWSFRQRQICFLLSLLIFLFIAENMVFILCK